MSAGMRKRTLPLSRVYRLLEPGPIVLVTTARDGRANVMAMSWQTMLEFEPPLVGCVDSNRNFSFTALRATGECVIAIPEASLASKVVGCGNVSGRRVDKFARFGLTPVPAAHVGAPLVAECFANLECRVVLVGSEVTASALKNDQLAQRAPGKSPDLGRVLQPPSSRLVSRSRASGPRAP